MVPDAEALEILGQGDLLRLRFSRDEEVSEDETWEDGAARVDAEYCAVGEFALQIARHVATTYGIPVLGQVEVMITRSLYPAYLRLAVSSALIARGQAMAQE